MSAGPRAFSQRWKPGELTPMRIVMLSDHEAHGGAARAAARLARALDARGHQVIRLVRFAGAGNPAWQTQLLTPVRPLRVAARVVGRLQPRARSFLEHLGTVSALRAALRELRPDVINVHNLHGAGWLPDMLEVCATQAPTVATLHDMWSFTGRCAYAYECTRFQTGCDAACPTPHEYPALPAAQIAAAFRRRSELFARVPAARLVAVCPSRWLAGVASSGLWRNHRVLAIANGLALDVFSPLEAGARLAARAELGLPREGLLGLVSASSVMDRRKGVSYLVSALSKAPALSLQVIAAGDGAAQLRLDHHQVFPLEAIDDDTLLARVYAAADVLLHPAPVDNLPNVVVEAMACGTPTVAFPVGGLPELVRPGQTGWLASELGADALRDALLRASQALQAGPSLRESCRATAEREYGEALQAERYEQLFQELIPSRGTPS